MNADLDLYEQMRIKLFCGFEQNLLAQLLKDRDKIRAPLRGTPEEFSQILYPLIKGELNKKNDTVSYGVIEKGNSDILKFSDGSLFRIAKLKGGIAGSEIVVTPYVSPTGEPPAISERPFAQLVFSRLGIEEAYSLVSDAYWREERRLASEKAAEERKISREGKLETALASIEKARSGETIMVRGLQNIDGLVNLGFVAGLIDNPDHWIDAEDFPCMRYRHARSGVEVLLTAREKIQPVEETSRLEFIFWVHRSDDDPVMFGSMLTKFREAKKDGTPYSTKEFHDDLLELVKYPEELKGRTEEDLGLMADEVELVIDRRQELDKGILPYEAVFNKDTQAIIDSILKNRTPEAEIRKALDYFEYTGMIDAAYKAALHRQIKAAIAPQTVEAQGLGDVLYDKRVKEILTEVLKKIPKTRVTASTITLALTPYIEELGFGKLVKIRDRILRLKQLVRRQQACGGTSVS